ncbi:CvpA family protein [Desulfovibrio ferrophilus]|uniref:Colicin V production protein n=1 Tax=Desulfovibrio ferrophilus TaxID=241368 RepID=A0A2Z6B2Q1_9BACT|nr:CvpA family protein [Desulfovibrio ferrophilus]BBD09718.1 colicin V production protein [Desulfovibrio ferrophilus]
MMISFLDVVFAVIALFFVVRGMFRGLFKEIASTVGVVAAYYVASNHNEIFVPFFQVWFKSPGLLHFLAYVSMFVAVMFGVMFVAWLLARMLRITPVFWVDVPGGMAVGFVKAWLVCAVALVGITSFMPDAEFVKTSKVVPYLNNGADFLAKYMPDNMKDFDPSILREKMEAEKKEAMEKFMSGGKGSDDKDGAMSEKSQEMLQKMSKSIKEMMSKDKE